MNPAVMTVADPPRGVEDERLSRVRKRLAACTRYGSGPESRTTLRFGSDYCYPDGEGNMILSTAKIEDFDRFVRIFSTKGAEKRKQHGCRGSTVFRDPNENDRVWAIFDWDAAGWQKFISDSEVPAIFTEAGLKGKPQTAEYVGHYDG